MITNRNANLLSIFGHVWRKCLYRLLNLETSVLEIWLNFVKFCWCYLTQLLILRDYSAPLVKWIYHSGAVFSQAQFVIFSQSNSMLTKNAIIAGNYSHHIYYTPKLLLFAVFLELLIQTTPRSRVHCKSLNHNVVYVLQ